MTTRDLGWCTLQAMATGGGLLAKVAVAQQSSHANADNKLLRKSA